jgi:membrane protease YdiL (CAAX protease family)
MHVQFDWFELSVTFALGVVFGAARALTNSTLLTIWLHCLVNLLACTGIEIVLQRFPVNN